jgi:TPR repeat protein
VGHKYEQNGTAGAYAAGSGVPNGDAEAVTWCLQAARRGIAKAQNSMGYLYKHGLGVPKDYGESVRWFGAAAEQKVPPAQYNLAQMYQDGYGVPRDYARAADLLTHAAAQGLAHARNSWGWRMKKDWVFPKMLLRPLTYTTLPQRRVGQRHNITSA